jgi:hypothetical protein
MHDYGGELMMTIKKYLAVIFAFFLIMCLASGCSTLKPAPVKPQSILEQLKPGDELTLTTSDGNTHEYTVKEVSTK